MTNSWSFSTDGNTQAVEIHNFVAEGEKVIEEDITSTTDAEEVDDIMDEIAQGDPEERQKHAEHKALAQRRKKMIPYIIVGAIVSVALVMVVVIMISRRKPKESA